MNTHHVNWRAAFFTFYFVALFLSIYWLPVKYKMLVPAKGSSAYDIGRQEIAEFSGYVPFYELADEHKLERELIMHIQAPIWLSLIFVGMASMFIFEPVKKTGESMQASSEGQGMAQEGG